MFALSAPLQAMLSLAASMALATAALLAGVLAMSSGQHHQLCACEFCDLVQLAFAQMRLEEFGAVRKHHVAGEPPRLGSRHLMETHKSRGAGLRESLFC